MNKNEICHEAIVLCGGESWRLKPDIDVPKPMLKLNKSTLLEYQLKWLIQHKFEHIIIASNTEYPIHSTLDQYVTWSIEKYKKGTGGAVMLALENLKGKSLYLMNVDDICFYNPIDLCMPFNVQARLLVSKPRVGFGRVELRQDLVLGFREKPLLDFYVSAGHYFMKKHIVEKYFPDNGNLEDTVLPRLARERILENYRLRGKWITVNTMKDYMEACEVVGSL